MRHNTVGSKLAPLSLMLLVACVTAVSAQPPTGTGVLATSACLNQTSAPSIIHQPHFSRGRSGAELRSVVRVGLGRNGIVHMVELVGPSGDSRFDTAAVAAARSSAFAPAARGCTAVNSRFDEAFTAAGGRVVAAKTQLSLQPAAVSR